MADRKTPALLRIIEGHDNIRRLWSRVDSVDRSEGMVAYRRYHTTLERLADRYGYPLTSVVGMFAALSPNNDYMNNLRSVASLLRGSMRTSTYNACRTRALRCMAGEGFLSFTKGPKTRSFYQNIMDPEDPWPVTVDGHAYCIYADRRMTMKDVAYLKFNYSEVADAYRIAALDIGLIPCQLQAILWFTWKRVNRIVYQPQMDMFRPGDQWMLDLYPHEISSFS
jgi:hypothetical protein